MYKKFTATQVDLVMGLTVLSKGKVKQWCRDLTTTFGRPNEVTTPEMGKKIHMMVLDDRRLKVRELADAVDVSDSAVFRILSENLDMRKLCARWKKNSIVRKFQTSV